VAVNCAAIPESLLESELFGYVSGAFTGAQKAGKAGYFELAHGGTIFLDEIGELPLSFQTRLLRVIQEREVMRLGGDSLIPLNIRIIAATNRDLEDLAAKGRFRQDLFFRLDVLRIDIPPLRERREDIPPIATEFFRSQFPVAVVGGDALEALAEMDWPGNIRQLRNYCERLAVLKKESVISRRDVEELTPGGCDAIREVSRQNQEWEKKKVDSESGDSERDMIVRALYKCRYNRSRTAKELGMDRSTLWRKMKMHDL
jgi:transcriptional regulator with PAS, ATPase and Fis domain